jgi:ketosteroid isomerase-like protein
MSQENVKLVHRVVDAWNRGDVDAFLSRYDPDCEVVEVMDAGDDVVAVLHMVGRGSGSGVDLDATDAHVFTIREGRIARWQNFNARVEALEAAGPSE